MSSSHAVNQVVHEFFHQLSLRRASRDLPDKQRHEAYAAYEAAEKALKELGAAVPTPATPPATPQKLRVWWLPGQTKSFYAAVDNLAEAAVLLTTLARYDRDVRDVSTTAGGLEVFDETVRMWVEWNNANDDDIHAVMRANR